MSKCFWWISWQVGTLWVIMLPSRTGFSQALLSLEVAVFSKQPKLTKSYVPKEFPTFCQAGKSHRRKLKAAVFDVRLGATAKYDSHIKDFNAQAGWGKESKWGKLKVVLFLEVIVDFWVPKLVVFSQAFCFERFISHWMASWFTIRLNLNAWMPDFWGMQEVKHFDKSISSGRWTLKCRIHKKQFPNQEKICPPTKTKSCHPEELRKLSLKNFHDVTVNLRVFLPWGWGWG